jgi:hypothetical protein
VAAHHGEQLLVAVRAVLDIVALVVFDHQMSLAFPAIPFTPNAGTSKWRRTRWNAPSVASWFPGSTSAKISTSAR